MGQQWHVNMVKEWINNAAFPPLSTHKLRSTASIAALTIGTSNNILSLKEHTFLHRKKHNIKNTILVGPTERKQHTSDTHKAEKHDKSKHIYKICTIPLSGASGLLNSIT